LVTTARLAAHLVRPFSRRGVRLATIVMALTVHAAALAAQLRPDTPAPSIVDRVRIDATRPIDFHAVLWPDTVYVGQQVNYQVGVFLSEDAKARLRRNPEFLPPELRGLIAYELGPTRRAAQREIAGRLYDAHVFQRALFPVASGEHVVPAPQLSYSLPRSSSYFSREETYVVRAESARLVVRALPEVGRPTDFNGAVGRFRASARVDHDRPRVGDPLVFTLRVEGVGNIKLLPRPELEVQWAHVVAASERLRVDSSGAMVRGTKDFDWILTPAIEGPADVPQVRYVYFDPYRREYDVALSNPVSLEVAPGSLVAADDADTPALLPLRDSLRTSGSLGRPGGLRDALPPLTWIILLALAPLPAAMVLVTRPTARRQRVPPPPPAMDLSALAAQSKSPRAPVASVDPSQQARTVRRALHQALAARLGVRLQQLTNRRHVARLLRRRGATRPTVERTLQLLEQLDQAGFASGESRPSTDFAAAAAELFAVIEQETLEPGHPGYGHFFSRFSVVVFCLFPLVLPIGPLRAQSEAAPRTERTLTAEFEAAGEAYRNRQFREAASRFAALANRAPDAIDILANWGTAAWAHGDTVSAVIAWQRAARRDPLAVDLQERLALLPAGARGGVAEVPLVSSSVLWPVGALAWGVGWALVALGMWRVRRHRGSGHRGDPREGDFPDALRGFGALLVVVGAGAMLWAWQDARANDPRMLYVVTRPETMRLRSGLDSDAVGGVGTGDVVRRLDAERTWLQVKHADGRTGWLPAARLVPIAADTPSIE
jgi:hypothetical protein